MFCSKCGNNIPDEADFCQICGEKTAASGRITENAIADYQNATVENKAEHASKKKSKKKITVIVIVVVLLAAVVTAGIVIYDYIQQLEHTIYCETCGNVAGGSLHIRDDKYFCSEACSHRYAVKNGTDEAGNSTDSSKWKYEGDTFSFLSSLVMPNHTVDNDYEEGEYFYEWSGEEVSLEVSVCNAPNGGGADILADRYNYAISYGEWVYDSDDTLTTDSGLPVATVWEKYGENDFSLTIHTYTEDFCYKFKISSYDEAYLVQMYDSIYYAELE